MLAGSNFTIFFGLGWVILLCGKNMHNDPTLSDKIHWLAYGKNKAVYAFAEFPWVLKFVPPKHWTAENEARAKEAILFKKK